MSDDGSELPSSITEAASEAVTALMTGVPPQIQRSFFKVVGRVFTASAEIPAKWLEDRAEIGHARRRVEIARHEANAAEIRSEQKAREMINKESAKVAALQFQNPDFANRALNFHAAHILREQQVREDVVSIATDHLLSQKPQQDSQNEIDEDWLTMFFREASLRSNDDFKQMFGRILAGEIKSPGTFSISTLQSLSRLTPETADFFQKCCNISTSIFMDSRVIADPFGQAGTNSLKEFGLYYSALARLVEEGLIRPEFNEYYEVEDAFYKLRAVFEHAGVHLFVTKDETPGAPEPPLKLRFTGPSFTRAGTELRSIVTMTLAEDYLKGLAVWLKGLGLLLYRVDRVEEGISYGNPV